MPAAPVPAHLEDLLRGPCRAVVGTLRADGAPVTVATWYLWLGDDRFMLSMGADGPRARNLRRDGRVSLTVLAEDWYEHVSLHGRVVELRPDQDWADLDAISHHYDGAPYPREPAFDALTAIVEVGSWHEFRSTTQRDA